MPGLLVISTILPHKICKLEAISTIMFKSRYISFLAKAKSNTRLSQNNSQILVGIDKHRILSILEPVGLMQCNIIVSLATETLSLFEFPARHWKGLIGISVKVICMLFIDFNLMSARYGSDASTQHNWSLTFTILLQRTVQRLCKIVLKATHIQDSVFTESLIICSNSESVHWWDRVILRLSHWL